MKTAVAITRIPSAAVGTVGQAGQVGLRGDVAIGRANKCVDRRHEHVVVSRLTRRRQSDPKYRRFDPRQKHRGPAETGNCPVGSAWLVGGCLTTLNFLAAASYATLAYSMLPVA